MCNRRNKPICQGAVFLALVGGLGYTMYLYSTISMDLEISKSETEKYLRQQESLSSQLQVVYEHRARLERSLQKEKTDHKNTKTDFSRKQNDFILNITRSKHEAMNRFNSLETQYNMLMAQNKELNTDYNRLRQQYTRLSSEQSQLNNQLKRNFQLYKEQKTNEIASLDEEIKTLKQQVVSLRTHLKSRADEVEQYKLSSSQALLANKKYQETIRTLQEQLASYKEKLREFQLRIDESEKNVKHDKGRKTAEFRQQGGKPLDSVKGEVDQGEKEKPHQERESHPVPSRNDRRHPAKDIPQEGYHGQTYIPSTFSNNTDSKDENNNKQKQDVDGERRPDQRQGNVPLRSREERKQNENSQIESEQRHDNVPLRDNNEGIRHSDRGPGVQVVAPTEKSMNKWADIIKVSQQNNAPEGGKTKNNNKGEEEEGEEEQENEERRNRRSVDDYKQEVNGKSQLLDSEMQRYNQRQPYEERGEEIGMAVAQATKGSDVRLEEPEYHSDTTQRAQDQYEHRSPERQQQDVNDEEEDRERDQDGHDSDLSRKNINKQVADMQEQYDKKQIKQQQQQQDILTLPAGQGGDVRQRSLYRQVAPIPAVRHRQDTAEEHKEQSDADNDDEDAHTEDDAEQDPDDADEEDVLEPQGLPQEQLQLPHQGQGQPHQGRTYDRTLKSADSNINYWQNGQKEE